MPVLEVSCHAATPKGAWSQARSAALARPDDVNPVGALGV